MEPFIRHDGLVMPLDRRDVDTDQIIPQRFLRKVARTGFGPDLFANLRYVGESLRPNPDFVLNLPRYAGASVLLARDNFGCGSSREHAPWALQEYGFRVLIAPSFADIFENNCTNVGLLTVLLDEDVVDELFVACESTPGHRLSVDLETETLTTPEGRTIFFKSDPFKKETLLHGLDPIARTLRYADDIAAYETRSAATTPWLSVHAPA